MQTRYGAAAAPPLRGVTPDAHKPGPTSHLEMRERGLVPCVAGPSDVISGTDFQGSVFGSTWAPGAAPRMAGPCARLPASPTQHQEPRARTSDPTARIACELSRLPELRPYGWLLRSVPLTVLPVLQV